MTEEGSCLIKWNCSLQEWSANICGDDYNGLIFASTVTNENMVFWIVSMVLLAFSLTCDCCNHLLYMRTAPPIFKIKLMLQVLISMNICLLNALLCAAQDTGFDMLMNSLGLLILNDLDDIIGQLFQIRAGIKLEQQEVEIHTRRDHFFSMNFAIPFIIWVIVYSLSFLHVFNITDPPGFIFAITSVQFLAAIVLIPIWYVICYLKLIGPCIDKCLDMESGGGEKGKEEEGQGGAEMV